MSRIVTLGSATQDIYMIDRDDFGSIEIADKSIFSQLAIGDKIDIDKIAFEVGGSGTNSAVTFARFGHETIFLGNLAHDPAGEAVLARLDAENIDTSYLNFLPGQTGCSVILLDAHTGKHTTLAFRGVSADYHNLQPADLETINPDWLYVTSLRGDMHKLLDFFTTAHALGAKVMFNPGPAELTHPKKLIGLLRDVDILLVDKREAAQIVPGVLLTELLSHLSNYCPTVLITDGAMGAIATDHAASYRLGVYEQKRFCDATGAGDAFGSGFLAAYADSGDFYAALQYAAANASKVTQFYGAQTGIITNDEPLHPMPIQQIEDLTGWTQSTESEP